MQSKLLGFFVVGFVALSVGYLNCAQPPSEAVLIDPFSGLSSCSDEPLLTSPILLTNVASIAALGSVAPPAQTFPLNRIKLLLTESGGVPNVTDLYAPANLRLISVTRTQYLSENPNYSDYELVFMACDKLQGFLVHVQSLNSKISLAVGDFNINASCSDLLTGGNQFRRCTKAVNLDFVNGEVLGTVGGRVQQKALDFGLRDARITAHVFSNPARYSQDSRGFDDYHIVCPLDYFTSSVKSNLRLKLVRTEEPKCGVFNYDVVNTAQGRWYKSDQANYPEDPHLALSKGSEDPTKDIFSVGTSVSGLANVYYYTPSTNVASHKNVRLDLVTADGNVYCYEGFLNDPSVSVLLQLLNSGNELRFRKNSMPACGAGPYSIGTAYTTFNR